MFIEYTVFFSLLPDFIAGPAPGNQTQFARVQYEDSACQQRFSLPACQQSLDPEYWHANCQQTLARGWFYVHLEDEGLTIFVCLMIT